MKTTKKPSAKKRAPYMLARFNKYVAEEWSEIALGDGYWMRLRPGFNLDGCSVIHETTRRKCLARLPEVREGEPC